MASDEQVNSILTREQRFRKKMFGKFFLDRTILFSKAFWSLSSPTSIRVLLIFMNKCRVEKEKLPCRKEKIWTIKNNGDIQFTYKEAEEYGICRKTFAYCLNDLNEKGFIDIAYQGSGLKKDKSLYAISDRWKDYGKPEFVKAKRKRRKTQYGYSFKLGNTYAKRKTQR